MRGTTHAIARARVLAATCGAALVCTSGVVRAAGDPSCGAISVALQPGVAIYRLPHAFLRAGGDSARTATATWRRGVDYALDMTRGELRLMRNATPGDTLVVALCWLLDPPPIEVQVQHYAPAGAAPADSAARAVEVPDRPVTQRSVTSAPGGASLAINGNKTLAVEFGSNQDATLRQSLDLSVSGALAPGVELTGVLSDRNTPLGATGSTQDLQAIDRVLLQLDAPHGSAALGDVALDVAPGEFAHLERRVQGVRGEYRMGDVTTTFAAADAQGEYQRMQFFGDDGRQGPYYLTDRSGNAGVPVVAGSEVVTLDGQRLTRGESADYAIDYERGAVTFGNRRPITAQSRITVDYQFTLDRYRRNLAAAGASWRRGALSLYTQTLTEGDDRGRPLAGVLDAEDTRTLAAAGDSASRAVGVAVSPGGGDYDTVRVDSTRVIYVWAGADSGQFHVSFAPVLQGRGDYADSAVVGGRTVYRWVGSGLGGFRVGRALPLPESHRLVTLGGTMQAGALTLEAEGAASRYDRNTFSSLDDRDNVGGAGRLAARLEGGLPSGGHIGASVEAHLVGERFAPFTRLAAPFAEESWGLPVGGDLEHARRVEGSTWIAPAHLGRLTLSGGHLAVPGGFASLRRSAEWSGGGTLAMHALWERADARQQDVRFADGGRDHRLGELRLVTRWLEPGLRVERDAVRAPSDTARVGRRFVEAAAELRSPRALGWTAVAGFTLRRDAAADSAGFADQTRSRIWRAAVETPATRPAGVSMTWQRRDVEPLAAGARSHSDLATARVRLDDHARGITSEANLELTSEGEAQRLRTLRYVGAGKGSFDQYGNFVGTGDYELVLTLGPALDRVARAATHAHATWEFGRGAVWQGSRLGVDFETETRRRGALALRDPILAPGAALGDATLARGSVLQRIEAELAPGSPAAAVRLRLERRVSADRSYENFAQTQDDRSASLRWRGRLANAWSLESEGQLQRSAATQAITSLPGYARTLLHQGVTGQLVWTPGPIARAAGVVESAWDRPQGQAEVSRTLRVGPDVGVGLGARGHAEASVRRAFLSGAAPVSLLPTAEPAGAPRWQATTRFDYRVRESVTAGISYDVRQHPGHRTLTTGRAEVRAFF